MEPHGRAPFLYEQADQTRVAELLASAIRWLVCWLMQVG